VSVAETLLNLNACVKNPETDMGGN